MGVLCCGCVAPASTKPRKTYNTLVPSLFSGDPIKIDQPLDSSLRRKIQKLQEYVQKNPAKIPKVSRRLMRRIRSTLLKPGDNLGHVKVAVHSYIYLLARSADEGSSYTPSFMAAELAGNSDAVIPSLLRDAHLTVRTLGAELLAVYSCTQTPVDNSLSALQELTPLVCQVARSALAAEAAGRKVADTAERRRAGEKLAVPNPLDLMVRKDPLRVAQLEAACLRALLELVALCSRSRVLPDHMELVAAVMLDNLVVVGAGGGEPSGNGSAPTAAPVDTSDTAPQSAPGPVDYAAYEALGISRRLPAYGTQAQPLARKLLRLLASFTGDVTTAAHVTATVCEYMDERGKWTQPEFAGHVVSVLGRAGSQQGFAILAVLLRHAARATALGPGDAAAVVHMAALHGAALEPGSSLPALVLALEALPAAWAAQATRGSKQVPLQGLLEAFKGSASAGGSGDLAQQLAGLQAEVLGAVRGLAAKLGSATELCEALTPTLAGAGAAVGSEGGAGAGAGGWGGEATLMVECCAAAAEAAAAGFAGSDAAALPDSALPAGLVDAVQPALLSESAALRLSAQRVLLALLPGAPKGVSAEPQALSLAAACCASLQQLRSAAAGGAAALGPDAVAGADALLRASLRDGDGGARPAVLLLLCQALLRLQRSVGASGYRGGGGSAGQAHAALLLFNSWVNAVVDAAHAPALCRQRLPLAAHSAALELTAQGLKARDAAFDDAAAAAALQALEVEHPAAAWAGSDGLQDALSGLAGLRAAYGEQLPGLLAGMESHAGGAAAAAGPGTRGAQPHQSIVGAKVNTVLLQRMSTLRKDLLHVGEVVRGSFTGRTTPVAAVAGSAPGVGPDWAASPGARSLGARSLGAGASPLAAEDAALLGGGEDGSLPLSLAQVLALSEAALSVAGGEHAAQRGGFVIGDVQISSMAGKLEPVLR